MKAHRTTFVQIEEGDQLKVWLNESGSLTVTVTGHTGDEAVIRIPETTGNGLAQLILQRARESTEQHTTSALRLVTDDADA